MVWVYLMQSRSYPDQRYIGMTSNLERRMEEHNQGMTRPTARYRPWELVVALLFRHPRPAEDFEKYLKSQGGRAFADSRLWTPNEAI